MAMWGSKKELTKPGSDAADTERLKNLQPIITLCQTRAQTVAGVLRSGYARSGRPLTKSGEEVIFEDVFAIVTNFARASAGISGQMGATLLDVGNALSNGRPISEDMYRVKRSLNGNADWVVHQFWLSYSRENASEFLQEPEVVVPLTVEALDTLDGQSGTDYAMEAARVLLDFASIICNHADRTHRESLVYVMDEYTRILTPFIQKKNSPANEDNGVTECVECLAAYRELGLERGASRNDIQAAYRDFAKMYHPDRFPESDQRLRERAEAEFKKLQQAHNHIIGHRHD